MRDDANKHHRKKIASSQQLFRHQISLVPKNKTKNKTKPEKQNTIKRYLAYHSSNFFLKVKNIK